MSGAFVLDCSVTMAWFFAGEATPETDGILDRLNQGGRAVVAQHWWLEVANTLLMGERRKRCTPADARAVSRRDDAPLLASTARKIGPCVMLARAHQRAISAWVSAVQWR